MTTTFADNPLLKQLKVLDKAICPEDVFEGDKTLTKDQLDYRYRVITKIVHPDRPQNKDNQENATKAFQILFNFYSEAKLKIEQGIYGNRSVKPKSSNKPLTFSAKKTTYILTELIHSGGTCGIFRGTATDSAIVQPIVARIPHSHNDNDLMTREFTNLKAIYKFAKPLMDNDKDDHIKKFLFRLPNLLDSIKLQEPGTTERRIVNIFSCPDNLTSGWFTIEQIREQYPKGVGTRIMAFILNRILEGMTIVHSAKTVHGALTPNHILIHAKNHLGNILDWSSSCQLSQSEQLSFIDDRYTNFYPLELQRGERSPTMTDDVYTIGWSMIYLLGGDPNEQTIPHHIEPTIREFLNICVQPKPKLRPANAEKAYLAFKEVLDNLFGKKREFAELVMKEIN